MYFPLQLRLTLFYVLLLGLALLAFGQTVVIQAEERAFSDLDNTLRSRAASVQLGKGLACGQEPGSALFVLPNVDSQGRGGVSIEVLDDQGRLLASTDDANGQPIPWDLQVFKQILARYSSQAGNTPAIFSTVTTYTYDAVHNTNRAQSVRVYSQIINAGCGVHVIQTAGSEQGIEQSLADLRSLLWYGGALVLVVALAGGWLLTGGVLAAVRSITRTAQTISSSRDFSRRVPGPVLAGQDELATLTTTFNEMLANLEEAYRSQQRFVADASHELRAPITSIRCNLDLLATAPDLPAQEAQAALADTRTEADRMGRLVNDLLTLARSDAASGITPSTSATAGNGIGGRPPQRVDLDSLLLEVFRQYRPPGEKGNRPRLLLQHIAPAPVFGDSDQLKQVLVALLDNALKYTPSEGCISLSLSSEKNGNDASASYALVRISDTGIGILPADLPHIFERFYRADRVRSRDQGGSGLGLAIVQSIVQQHHGVIEVESVSGNGSTFTLKLPLDTM